ncbi:unnamed protein product [Mytilus edulis]|uniref:Uncharacterized protein n=1 Tax=Mytilus edulis TaxID=6550 RepID=A0A8S3QWZ5_MYTED|nr:unnamed protein product [Mytilus edulis]
MTVQNLGLAANYRRRPAVRTLVRQVMAIGYLPIAVVCQNFRLLRTSHKTQRPCRRYDELRDFLDYFERNYLNGLFPKNELENNTSCKAITSDSDDGLDINELQHDATKAATENILSMRNCNASTKTESDKIENNIQRTNLPSNTMSNSTNSASKLTPQLINATSGPCTQAQTSA